MTTTQGVETDRREQAEAWRESARQLLRLADEIDPRGGRQSMVTYTPRAKTPETASGGSVMRLRKPRVAGADALR